jgi:hypothetical protein
MSSDLSYSNILCRFSNYERNTSQPHSLSHNISDLGRAVVSNPLTTTNGPAQSPWEPRKFNSKSTSTLAAVIFLFPILHARLVVPTLAITHRLLLLPYPLEGISPYNIMTASLSPDHYTLQLSLLRVPLAPDRPSDLLCNMP